MDNVKRAIKTIKRKYHGSLVAHAIVGFAEGVGVAFIFYGAAMLIEAAWNKRTGV